MEIAQKKAYEKPAVRRMPLEGAFTIGTYSCSPNDPATGRIDPNNLLRLHEN